MAKKQQHDAWIQVRCPQEITAEVKRAAKARNLTASNFVRAAITEQIERDSATDIEETRAAAATQRAAA